MSQPTQPLGPPPPQPHPMAPPRKPKRFGWAALLITALAALGLGAAVGAAGDGSGATTARPAPTVTETVTEPAVGEGEGTEAPEPEPDPTKAPAAFNPKPKDFKVGIKVLEKECFGSAGCSISYRIVPNYKGSVPIPADAVLDVTYEVSGAEDPIIGTFTVEDAKASFNEEESASTTSSAKKLTAKVTEVTVQ
jgi:hypothetical protein